MRKKFLFILAILSLVAAACGSDGNSNAIAGCPDIPSADGVSEDNDLSVALVYDIGGRGDQSFNDSAFCGLQVAGNALGVDFTDAAPNADGSNRTELLELGAANSDLVVGVGFLFESEIAAVSQAFSDVEFGVIDAASLDFENGGVPFSDNLSGLVFAEQEGSFLVGAAAALESKTGQLGFIGGVSGLGGLIEKFEAGFVAGAQQINPDIQVEVVYISAAPDFVGFGAPDQAKDIANQMYSNGADVVYHAAGGSGGGLFQAAAETSEGGDKVWAIGVDSDQYNTADEGVRDFILTSMLKRVDVAIYEIIAADIRGDKTSGPTVYDLSVDGVGYSTTGGFVDDYVDQLDGLKDDIVSGAITVPDAP